MRRLTVLGLAGITGAAGLAGWLLLRSPARHHPPMFPQFRREVRDQLTSAVRFATRFEPEGWRLMVDPPERPKVAKLPSVDAYRSAIAANQEHPGAQAFRADTDFFFEYNRKQAEDQARKEGLTLDEVKELTFFGYAAMRVSQPEKVAEVLGRPLSPDEAQALGSIVMDENKTFQDAMHQAVDQGDSAEQRWQIIRSFEQHFTDQFQSKLGVSAAQFDQMLAPDPEDNRPQPASASVVVAPTPGPIAASDHEVDAGPPGAAKPATGLDAAISDPGTLEVVPRP